MFPYVSICFPLNARHHQPLQHLLRRVETADCKTFVILLLRAQLVAFSHPAFQKSIRALKVKAGRYFHPRFWWKTWEHMEKQYEPIWKSGKDVLEEMQVPRMGWMFSGELDNQKNTYVQVCLINFGLWHVAFGIGLGWWWWWWWWWWWFFDDSNCEVGAACRYVNGHLKR